MLKLFGDLKLFPGNVMWQANITVDLHESFVQQIIGGSQTMTYALNKQWHFSFYFHIDYTSWSAQIMSHLSIFKHLVQCAAPELK